MSRLFKLSFLILNFSFLITFSSCKDEDDTDPYPSIITELVDCPATDEGKMVEIVLDKGTHLPITNNISGLKANVVYRALAGYTLDNGKVTLYQLTNAVFLRDSTTVATTDPTNVASVWRTPKYINLHLLPKTQGGQHSWGFITDSIVGRHAYLRLHHRQGNDPTAYTADQYASLYLQDVAADTITIRILTFNGTKQWTL